MCIVGGGYTGLWSALEIKRRSPETSVILLEADGCGFGASGRNGGWATSWYDELDRLVDRFGEAAGLELANHSSDAVRRLGEFAEEYGVDCDFRPEGSLWVATSEDHEAAVEEVALSCERAGRGSIVERVDSEGVAEMTGSRIARGGLLIKDGAAVQPASLARGLRDACIREGVVIHEGSPMLDLERRSPALVRTSAGTVEADQVVLATNVWSAKLRELRRSVFIVAAQIVLTEPLGDRLPGKAWQNGLLFGDARMFVHFAQITGDGRIAFGRGGGAISAGGRVIPKHFFDPGTVRTVIDDFHKWFPELSDVAITHAWGGPVDRAPGHLPFVGSLGEGNIHYGLGYSGNGVGPSNLIGRILAVRALGEDDPLARSPLVTGPPGLMPPEPFRFAGAALLRNAIQRTESREERGLEAGLSGKLAKRMVNFALPTSKREEEHDRH